MKEQLGETEELTFEEASALIERYVDYYNNRRGQERLE